MLSITQKRIIKNLKKMGFELEEHYNGNLIWNYKIHYSEFDVKLYFYDDNDKGEYVKYSPSKHISGIRNKKTSTKYSYCYTTIFKVLTEIKTEFDNEANKVKLETDLKTQYCIEFERYYKRKFKNVRVNVSKSAYSDALYINVTGYNDLMNKNNTFNITYSDKKYLLTNEYASSFEEIETNELVIN